MAFKEMFQEENLQMEERAALVMERLAGIQEENSVSEPYIDFFRKEAAYLLRTLKLREELTGSSYEKASMEELQKLNKELYEDILPENYITSYGNPDYAAAAAGETYGPYLTFLYAELRGMIVYAYENRLLLQTIFCELFIEVYNIFESEEEPSEKALKDCIYWFMSDYSDVLVKERISEQIDPAYSFAAEIIQEADFADLRYLFRFGEYISENEIQTAEYLGSLPEEKIKAMADTYTEGYRIGFVKGNKDLSIKGTVNIRYQLGFERIIKEAIKNFKDMGLKPVIYRTASSSINKRQHHRIGYYGSIPNPQFDFDHKGDNQLYLDKPFVERKLSVIKDTYEKNKELAGQMAGPAVVETFGEVPFAPENKETALSLTEKQQQLSVYFDNESAKLTNQYIKGEERSFTIIAFPVPEIGEKYKEIFDEVVKINTLDYQLYEKIQQKLIDTLDQGEYAHVLGSGNNETDLKIHLYPLADPALETKFENCVADVNIPVGEVFTSPVLQGTEGLLHVTQVYLNGLKYENLKLKFQDGKIAEYSCTNFETEEENKKYVAENVLFNHETLPMGEFAIGTNTTAYVTAEKYGIADKLPILIAEKMGPHFAVGDTCYSWSEDMKVYNPDGKEIVARDNEQSVLRKEDIGKAYFNCHTDITIPYDELKELSVWNSDGSKKVLIADGRFVLEGTEPLNEPFADK